MSSPTNAELLAAARTALKRVLTGARSVTLNGQQFHYSSVAELRALIAELEVAVAEEMQIQFDRANGVTDMGVLRAPGRGVRVFVYNEWYTDPATGTLVNLWPADTILLGNTNARVEIHCRPIEDFAIGRQFPEAGGGNILAIPRFAKSWEKENPSSIQLLMQAAPCVVPFDLHAFLKAKVLNTPAE